MVHVAICIKLWASSYETPQQIDTHECVYSQDYNRCGDNKYDELSQKKKTQ